MDNIVNGSMDYMVTLNRRSKYNNRVPMQVGIERGRPKQVKRLVF